VGSFRRKLILWLAKGEAQSLAKKWTKKRNIKVYDHFRTWTDFIREAEHAIRSEKERKQVRGGEEDHR
jgi:hypothetical protein